MRGFISNAIAVSLGVAMGVATTIIYSTYEMLRNIDNEGNN